MGAPQLSYAQPAAQPATQSVLLLLGDLRRRRRTSTLCGDFYSVFLKNPSLIVNEGRRSAPRGSRANSALRARARRTLSVSTPTIFRRAFAPIRPGPGRGDAGTP